MLLSRKTISASYRSFLGDQTVDRFLGSGAADRYVEENVDRCLGKRFDYDERATDDALDQFLAEHVRGSTSAPVPAAS